MPSLIEVLESRIGIAEIAGKKHNPAILEMWKDAGHPEIQTDEEFWCSAAMCSAAKHAGLPMPPVNINPMARSWLTWGVKVEHQDVQRNDVVVWPRGKPGSGSGHVNCVAEVRTYRGKVQVKCVGGNQAHESGGAITLTDWTNISGALPNGVRRPVPPTVKDLRDAGSTTIKSADNEEKLGIVATFFAPLFEGVRAIINGIPSVSTSEGLSYLETAGRMAGGVLTYVGTNPWVLSFTVAGLLIWLNSQRKKRSRVAEHAAGIPIAAEVAALEAA